ncbi:unnamed protein product [Caenorhabditis brenneri]
MATAVQYRIAELPKGDHSNKVASILKNKYEHPSKKRITLNERFGVLEKGYCLEADEPTHIEKDSDVFLVVYDRNLISKKEFIENYLAKNPAAQKAEEVVEEDKENAPTKKSTPKSVAQKEFTTEDYVRDITKSILKPI